MKLETKAIPFDIKAAGDGSTFEGFGAVFFNIDAAGDIYDDAAFDEMIPQFLDSGAIRDEHYVTIGRPTAAVAKKSAGQAGLYITGAISDTAAGRDSKVLLKDGVIKSLSIGAYNSRVYLETPEEVQGYWNSKGYTPTELDLVRARYGASLIVKAKPREVSLVFNPANERARILSVKSAGTPGGRTFDDHSESVLAAVEEFLGRATALSEKRAADGRALSPKHLASFRRLADGLARLVSPEPKSADATPPATETENPAAEGDPATAETPAAPSVSADHLFAHFLSIEASLNGVALGS